MSNINSITGKRDEEKKIYEDILKTKAILDKSRIPLQYRTPDVDPAFAASSPVLETGLRPKQDTADSYKVDAEAYNNVVTGGSDGVMTYSQYLEQSKNNVGNIYDKSVAAIDKSSADALAKIEEDRQAGIRNANAAYEQSKATYGANAEALRRMGLTGSGYSDYLTSSAYAASRGEIANVNATAQGLSRTVASEAEQQKLDALTKYEDNLRNLDEKSILYSEQTKENKKTAFDSLLEKVNSGAISDMAQIEKLAKDSGLDFNEAQMLVDAAQTYKNVSYASALSESGDIFGGLQAAIDAGTITYEQGVEELTKVQDANALEFNKILNEPLLIDADFTGNVDATLKNHLISQTQYDKIKERFQKTIDTDADFFVRSPEQGGGDMDAKEARKAIDDLENTGWAKPEQIEALNAAYEKKYGISVIKDADIKQGQVVVPNFAYNVGNGVNLGNIGKNVSVTDNDGNQLKLESGGIVQDPTTKQKLSEKAKNVTENQIFRYGDNLYVRHGNSFYYIVGRGGKKNTEDYNNVMASLTR